MKFNIGDKVQFLNEQGGGIIVKALSKTTVLVRVEDGFDIPCQLNELLSAEGKLLFEETYSPVKEYKNSFPPARDSGKKKKSKKAASELEIDLHIEELPDNTLGLSNGEKLEIQLKYFQKELDKAVLNKHVRKITFIHGVGSGRLKQELYNILRTYEKIRYYDAPYRKYGFGATEVVIR